MLLEGIHKSLMPLEMKKACVKILMKWCKWQIELRMFFLVHSTYWKDNLLKRSFTFSSTLNKICHTHPKYMKRPPVRYSSLPTFRHQTRHLSVEKIKTFGMYHGHATIQFYLFIYLLLFLFVCLIVCLFISRWWHACNIHQSISLDI